MRPAGTTRWTTLDARFLTNGWPHTAGGGCTAAGSASGRGDGGAGLAACGTAPSDGPCAGDGPTGAGPPGGDPGGAASLPAPCWPGPAPSSTHWQAAPTVCLHSASALVLGPSAGHTPNTTAQRWVSTPTSVEVTRPRHGTGGSAGAGVGDTVTAKARPGPCGGDPPVTRASRGPRPATALPPLRGTPSEYAPLPAWGPSCGDASARPCVAAGCCRSNPVRARPANWWVS